MFFRLLLSYQSYLVPSHLLTLYFFDILNQLPLEFFFRSYLTHPISLLLCCNIIFPRLSTVSVPIIVNFYLFH